MSVESGVLRVKLTGTFSLDEAKRNFTEVLDAMAQENVDKVLFDGREVGGEPRFMERYAYGEFTATAVTDALLRGALSGCARFAYVVKRPVFDPQTISEVVAQNRGMRFQVFEHMESAQAWLGLPAQSPR